MLAKDVTQLSEPYPPTMRPEDPPLLRLAGPLGLNLARSVELGDEICGDLDSTVYGIGWWNAYPDLDRQARILLSDYLLACARAVPDNLVEARMERLELDHAVEDFRQWMSRGVNAGERSTVEAPRSPYEELSIYRVRTHLAGALRAWGSALDCVGGCVIGVAGLSSNLIRADLDSALRISAAVSPGNQVLAQLQSNLEQAEANAGPAGWRDWLLGMRDTDVHRGRRTVTWSGNSDGNEVRDFTLRLPIQPNLTEVDSVVQAGGILAATFTAPSADMLDELTKTVGTYVSDACGILTELWRTRRANPGLLPQSPGQWRQPPGLITPPVFRGFPHLALPASQVTSLGVSPEGERRLRAAALLKPDGARLQARSQRVDLAAGRAGLSPLVHESWLHQTGPAAPS